MESTDTSDTINKLTGFPHRRDIQDSDKLLSSYNGAAFSVCRLRSRSIGQVADGRRNDSMCLEQLSLDGVEQAG